MCVGVFQEKPGEAHGTGGSYTLLFPEKVGEEAEEAALRGEERGHEEGEDGGEGQGEAPHHGHGEGEPVERGRVSGGSGEKTEKQGLCAAPAEFPEQSQAERAEQNQRRADQNIVREAEPQAQGNKKGGKDDGRLPGRASLRGGQCCHALVFSGASADFMRRRLMCFLSASSTVNFHPATSKVSPAVGT